jgi:hypothetical protein
MTAITAPAGWGWREGAIISGITADDLPAIPDGLDPYRRNAAIRDALLNMPALLPVVRPRDLIQRYGIPQATAQEILARARQCA